MLPATSITTTIARARTLPVWVRYLATCGIVAAAFPLGWALQGVLPPGYPFLPFLLAILVAGSLFDHGSGFLATALSALLTDWLSPGTSDGPLSGGDPQQRFGILLFVVVGMSVALVIEALHRALLRARRAQADLARSEERRRLLLHEFRHRTRNDLQSLSALLLLRARAAPSSAAADGLREAAEHARALARVHAWLAQGDARDAANGGTTPRAWTPRTSSRASAATSNGRRPVANCGPSP